MLNPFKNTGKRSAENDVVTQTAEVKVDSMSVFKNLSSSVSTDTAMKFTAVFAAMRLRAEAIASLPKTIKEITDQGNKEASNHPVFDLLRYEPNGYMNSFNFWEFINTCLDGWGNSYVLIKRAKNGVPEELIPIHPYNVNITIKNRKKWFRISGTTSTIDGDGVYSDDDILHFFALSKDGIQGVNPILYNSEAIRSGITATEYGRQFFENGGEIKGVYESENVIGAADFKMLLDNLSNLPVGATPILEGGLKYKSISIQPEAAQMLQTRAFAIQDIARIFNIPPHMLSDLSHATFSNIEHQDIQYVKHSIRPPVKRYEMELDRKLFFTSERGKYQIKFNLEGLLRGDSKTRYENYQRGILSGWMNRNEARQLEGLHLVEGLDEFIYPSNMLINGDNDNNKKNDKN